MLLRAITNAPDEHWKISAAVDVYVASIKARSLGRGSYEEYPVGNTVERATLHCPYRSRRKKAPLLPFCPEPLLRGLTIRQVAVPPLVVLERVELRYLPRYLRCC